MLHGTRGAIRALAPVMRTLILAAVLLGGCYTNGPGAPAVRTPPAPARYEPDVDCTPLGEVGKRAAFEPGATVELLTCATGPDITPDNVEAVKENRKAVLVLHGKRPEPLELGAWSDGWEWGESWTLEGVLRAADRGAVVVSHSAYSDGGTGIEVLVMAIGADGQWRTLAQQRADEAKVTITGAELALSTCADPDGNGMTEACRANPAHVHEAVFHWDGAKLAP